MIGGDLSSYDTNSNPFHSKSACKRLLFNNFKEYFENFNGTLVIRDVSFSKNEF